MKRKISLLSLLLVAALVLGMMPFGAFRTEAYAATTDGDGTAATSFDVQGSKLVDEEKQNLDPDHRETTVTLQLPAGEYQNAVDIVFVMDNSTSVANAGLNFSDNAKSLFDKIVEENEGIDLKVGVVKFRGYATDMLKNGLMAYNADNKATIIAAIANNSVPGSGSNMHSGMVMAEQLLSADEEVDDSNKYVILLTDCKSYIWNNAANEPTTYYAQYAQRGSLKNSGKPMLNQWAPMYNKEAGEVYTTLPQIKDHTPFNMLQKLGTWSANDTEDSSQYYQYLFDVDNAEIAATDTKYDSPCYYSKFWDTDAYVGTTTPGDGTVTPRSLTSGPAIFYTNGQQIYQTFYDYTPTAGTFWEDINYLELAPYEVIYNEADKTYNYDTDSVNEDFWMWHPSNLEKGIYQAGHYWKDVLSKYNTAAIATYKAADGTGSHICGSYRTWLFENSDYAADVNVSDEVIALFSDIDNSIRYMVSEGVVTDEIADNFTLKNTDKADCFRMTLDGKELSVDFSNGEWKFGTPNEGKYPYVVSLEDNNTKIRWTINVPVENLKPVTLSYDLEIDVDAEERPDLENGHPTNGDTILSYKTTDGKPGTYEFKVPMVTYVKKHLLIYHSNYPDTENESQLEVDREIKEYPTEIESSDDVEFTVEGKWTNTSTGKEYEFTGWNTKADGSGDPYDPEDEFNGPTETTDDQNNGQNDQNNGQNDQNNGQNDAVPVDPTVTNIVGNSLRSILRMVAVATSSEEEPAEKADLELYAQWEEIVPPGGGGSTPKTYTVTYRYTGTVPAGAPSTPATKSYTAGAAVPSAATPSMEGYTFSGWSGEVSVMPSHDVTVTGSWTPVEDSGDETDIDDGDTPLAPGTIDDETDIDDGDTPLAPSETEDTEIDEEATPLSPFTGDSRHTAVWAGISVAALLGIIFLGKKRKING